MPIPLLALAVSTASPAPIEGLWKNPTGSAIIAIGPCGGAMCGKVVWASAQGRREAAKGAPDVVGTTVLTDLRERSGRWTGMLFIPDDNIHVAARLQPIGGHQMKLTGCAIAGLFCRSQVWTRTEGPLPGEN